VVLWRARARAAGYFDGDAEFGADCLKEAGDFVVAEMGEVSVQPFARGLAAWRFWRWRERRWSCEGRRRCADNLAVAEADFEGDGLADGAGEPGEEEGVGFLFGGGAEGEGLFGFCGGFLGQFHAAFGQLLADMRTAFDPVGIVVGGRRQGGAFG